MTLFNLNYSGNVTQYVTDNDGVNVRVDVGVKLSKSEFDVYSEIINNNLTAEEISIKLN